MLLAVIGQPGRRKETEMTKLGTMREAAGSTASGDKGHVVSGGAGYRAEQGSDYLPGISAETVGSKALWLGIVTLPAGQRTKAHVHERHETAFYMMSGEELELWTGDRLQHCDKVHAGDYVFIPANVLHVAVNRSAEPAVFIGSRNEPTAQESLVMHPDMDACVQ
jgi:uncharacterized RmlC-like cupin family protein